MIDPCQHRFDLRSLIINCVAHRSTSTKKSREIELRRSLYFFFDIRSLQSRPIASLFFENIFIASIARAKKALESPTKQHLESAPRLIQSVRALPKPTVTDRTNDLYRSIHAFSSVKQALHARTIKYCWSFVLSYLHTGGRIAFHPRFQSSSGANRPLAVAMRHTGEMRHAYSDLALLGSILSLDDSGPWNGRAY